MEVRAEWKKGPDFAEYAEALGIRTNQIMAVHATGKAQTVIYTPELDEDDLDPETAIFANHVARDQDGILHMVGEPYMLDLNWAEMRAGIERELEERFGDSPS